MSSCPSNLAGKMFALREIVKRFSVASRVQPNSSIRSYHVIASTLNRVHHRARHFLFLKSAASRALLEPARIKATFKLVLVRCTVSAASAKVIHSPQPPATPRIDPDSNPILGVQIIQNGTPLDWHALGRRETKVGSRFSRPSLVPW